MQHFITLTANNCTAKAISHKNNVLVNVNTDKFIDVNGQMIVTVVMNKKYFNQISTFGEVQGRLKTTEDGLIIFEGFSFR
jgi:hypothetical protein|tara:strand:- start:62 stop:301 length:240 start_codon:yes stop_codon:yes gene_type:complete